MECARCKKTCQEGEGLTCAQCNCCFHFGCANVKEVMYKKWPKEKQESWGCSLACRSLLASQSAKELTLTLSPNASASSEGNGPTLSDINSKLLDLCNSIDGLVTSNQFQSDKLDNVLKLLNVQEEKVKAHEKKLGEQDIQLKKLQQENQQLTREVNDLKDSVCKLDQYSRNRNIEIQGIQERENENVTQIVKDVAKLLKLPLENDEIEKAHRLPRSVKTKKSSIIVQFRSRVTRDEWLRKRKTGLICNNIIQGSSDDPVYINVNLAPKRKELFWKARIAKKNLNYLYCWVTENGDIFLKKNEKSNKILIRTERDLPFLSNT